MPNATHASANLLHKCTCAITYRAMLTGQATEEDRQSLLEIRDEEDGWAAAPGPTSPQQFSQGRGGSGLGFNPSDTAELGALVPVHASVTIGATTLERSLLPSDTSESRWPMAVPLADKSIPGVHVVDALKLDSERWRELAVNRIGSHHRRGRQPRRLNAVARAALRAWAMVLRQGSACLHALTGARLPVLNTSTRVFVMLTLLNTLILIFYAVWLLSRSMVTICDGSNGTLPGAAVRAAACNHCANSIAGAHANNTYFHEEGCVDGVRASEEEKIDAYLRSMHGTHGSDSLFEGYSMEQAACIVERTHVGFFGTFLLLAALLICRSCMQVCVPVFLCACV